MLKHLLIPSFRSAKIEKVGVRKVYICSQSLFQTTFVLQMAFLMEVEEQSIWKTTNGEQCVTLRSSLQNGLEISANSWDSVRHGRRNLSTIPIWSRWVPTTRLATLISHVIVIHRGTSVLPEMVRVLMPKTMFTFGANKSWHLVVITFDAQMLNIIVLHNMLGWCTHRDQLWKYHLLKLKLRFKFKCLCHRLHLISYIL